MTLSDDQTSHPLAAGAYKGLGDAEGEGGREPKDLIYIYSPPPLLDI